MGDLLPRSRRLRFLANVSNVKAFFRLELMGPTNSLTFVRNLRASFEARTSSSDFARVVYIGWTIRVAHNASTDVEGVKAGGGFLRDVPAATTLVRKANPSINDLSTRYTLVLWRSLYGMTFDSRYVLSWTVSEG